MISWLIDLVLHLDRHLVDLLSQHHLWVYPILFCVIFAETGLVVTPFLPGDSLLFATGALAAVDTSGTLNAPALNLTVIVFWPTYTGPEVHAAVGRMSTWPPAGLPSEFTTVCATVVGAGLFCANH